MADPTPFFLRLHQPVHSRLLLEAPDSKLLLGEVVLPDFFLCSISTSSPQMTGTVSSSTSTRITGSVTECLCNSKVESFAPLRMDMTATPVVTGTATEVRC